MNISDDSVRDWQASFNLEDLFAKYEVQNIRQPKDIRDIVKEYMLRRTDDAAFYVANISEVIMQYEKWVKFLPRVKPFYSVKVNFDPFIMEVVGRIGCGFDCASAGEIDKSVAAGATPENIIYGHPCKMVKMINRSKELNVDVYTFDSVEELEKMKKHHPEARLLLRIAVDDKNSRLHLSKKFGCKLADAEHILKMAKELSMDVVGVAFHVGSGCYNPYNFYKAIEDSRTVFDIGKSLGIHMNLLDIGGGFPGKDVPGLCFEDMAKAINSALDDFFNEWQDLKVISEPGRFFVTTAYTLVTKVIAKKSLKDPISDEKTIRYTLNESIYNCFYNIWVDDVIPDPTNFLLLNPKSNQPIRSTIMGHTCTELDTLSRHILLPELDIGETLIHPDMGAYTVTMAPGREGFCGFFKADVYFFCN